MPSLGNARREAGEISDEVKWLLKNHATRVTNPERAAVEQAKVDLDAARKTRDAKDIVTKTGALDELLQRHFGPVRKGAVRQYVESIGKAVLIALVLRIFVIEAFKIPSGSMYPTLVIGDHLFVAKFSYGIRLPFINYQLWQAATPQRGDVIVFNSPREPDKDLIKRVVGVPGDTIRVIDEQVEINGQLQPRKLVSNDYFHWDYHDPETDPQPWGWFPVEHQELYTEDLPGKTHELLQEPYARPRPTQGPFVVPKDSVFVMGDNRDNSADSRYYGGWYVPYGNIKGKAMIIWLSVGKGGWWFCHGAGPLCTESGIHFDRFFKILH